MNKEQSQTMLLKNQKHGLTVYFVCSSVANDEKKRYALTGEPLWDEMLFPDLKMPGKDVFEWLKAFKANESYKKFQ